MKLSKITLVLHFDLEEGIILPFNNGRIMKPEALKPSPAWGEKKIWIEDRVWYVPGRSSETPFTFPGWQAELVFGNSNPVCVEYCSGNGAWVAARAGVQRHLNWVAVERKFSRVRKIWSKVKNDNLPNLLILCGEGQNATNHYFPSESVHHVYVNFPDPWPKKRHFKNRIINAAFAQDVWRILEPNGILTIVTDDPGYSEWIVDVVLKHGGWQSLHPDPFYATECVDYGTSYFEELWRSKGLTIRYHQFKKQSC